MTTLSPIQAHETIASYAKTASQAVRRLGRAMKPGEYARQGDLYLIAIKARPKGSKAIASTGEVQLAQGATMGSRHMLQMREGIAFYRVASPGPLDGGTIVAKSRAYISHPEHAHMDLPPGTYAVRYQQDLMSEEIRAVRD